MSTQIQQRRDTASNWTSVNPVLAQGELAIETDTGKIKIGDGTKTWTQLSYFSSDVGFSAENISNKKTSLTDNSDTYYPSQKAVKTAVDAKQDTLVSGTSIKTINGESVLGSGNITISGGGSINDLTTNDRYRSSFNTVLIARLNGNNYDNSFDNYIECLSATDTVLTLNAFPDDFVVDTRKEWGIFAFANSNFSETSGDYTGNLFRKIASSSFDAKTLTISGGGANFAGKKLCMICYTNIGDSVETANAQNEILSVSQCNTLFGTSISLGSTYITVMSAFIDSDGRLVCIFYFKNGTYWQPHYVTYSDANFTVYNYGKCFPSETFTDNTTITGTPYDTGTQLIFHCQRSVPVNSYAIYTKATKAWTISSTDIITATPPDSMTFWQYPSFIGFDGTYYYITALARNASVPSVTTETPASPYWSLCELRSTSLLSGYSEYQVILRSYDDWGFSYNYPEVSVTINKNNEILLMYSGTNFVTLSGCRANRMFGIMKRLSYGKYIRDQRNPLVINPMYDYENTDGNLTTFPYAGQRDHMGASPTMITWNGITYMLYTACQGSNTYLPFAVIKKDLDKVNIL